MNDLEEIRFGINQGLALFDKHNILVSGACALSLRTSALKQAFYHFYEQFDRERALDTYVFCLSEHDPSNTDGLLSMWRAYGAQGNGVALVFNTNYFGTNENSPLLIAKVRYGSADERTSWLEKKLIRWCEILQGASIPDEKLYLAAYALFDIVKMFALITKHHGFQEEKEWRVIYIPERDTNGLLKEGFHYFIGNRGVEPKLKFKVAPSPIAPSQTWTFSTIVDSILLGPSVSSPLARSSVGRMLETIGKSELRSKIQSSGIPL